MLYVLNYKAEGTRLSGTDLYRQECARLLSQMRHNHIEIGLEVSKVSNCNQLKESFYNTPETDKQHTFQKCLHHAVKSLNRFF
jgi:hypothetical protein